MKISVIMISHNREAFVGNMINDVLGQTFSDFEFIIVDNGSIDQSGKIIDSFVKEDERIVPIYLSEEVSIGRARNIGLSSARGEFVTYVDDDDRIDKDFLDFLDSLLSDENIDFAMCGAVEKRNGKITPQCEFEGKYILNAKQAVVELLKREHIRAGMPTKLFRRNILCKYPFKEDCQHEDIHTIYKYLSEIRQGIIVGTSKYCFVRHGSNVSYFTTDFTVIQSEQLEEYLQAFQERTEFISAKFPELIGIVQYSQWSYMISMYHKIIENNLVSCEKQLLKIKSELSQNKEEFCSSRYIKNFEKEWMGKYIND